MAIIDCIRTMVLIAGEGVKPSLHDHGYRLRQLSKRFVQRKIGVDIDTDNLIRVCLESWKTWGFKPSLDEKSIIGIIKMENDRNFNSLFLLELNKEGFDVHIDINQDTESFLRQVKFSLTKETIDSIINKIR